MTLQLIILAGGKGTRISPVIGRHQIRNISGKPFLEWFINWVETWNIKINPQILLSTGKGHNIIEDYCKKNNI